MNGPRTPYKCRSEPQIAVEVSRTIASVGCSIFGSGTSSTRTSLVPCQTTAFIAALLPPPPLLVLLAAAAWLGLARLSRGLRGLGMTRLEATWALFFIDPATTWSLPAISASKPSLATSAGSSLAVCSRSLVPCMPARSKNSVSVGPGISAVTVTPVSRSS